MNSIFVAAAATLISVALSSLAAYALTRLRFLGAGMLTTLLLITYLLPGTLLFIPLYQTLTSLGIINTYAALILTDPDVAAVRDMGADGGISSARSRWSSRKRR